MKTTLWRLAATLVVGLPTGAMADPPPQYTPNQFVSAILSGPMPCPAGKSQAACEANPRTRRWSLEPPIRSTEPVTRTPVRQAFVRTSPGKMRATEDPEAGAAADCGKVTAQDICITFSRNSDQITPIGQANLRSAAQGLNTDSLASLRFEVAGYTDDTGSAAHNLELSDRRAAAVKAYLVQHGIDGQRLTTAGYGSEHPALPDSPESSQNRRVELHRLN